MAERETLIQKFARKHFSDTPAHRLRSVNFGKHVYQYFTVAFDRNAYNPEIIDDPAVLLNTTRALFESHDEISDEMFVDFLIQAINLDPYLVDFAMVADLVESDAYKQYGNKEGTSSHYNKHSFEKWLLENSILAQVDKMAEFDVINNEGDMMRTLAALSDRKNDAAKQTSILHVSNQIDNARDRFEKTYIENASDNLFEELREIAANTAKDDFSTQLKKVYRALLAKNDVLANHVIPNMIDSSTNATGTKMISNVMTTGWGLSVNNTIQAYAKYLGWTEEMINQVYLKFPIERRIEKFNESLGINGNSEDSNKKTLLLEDLRGKTPLLEDLRGKTPLNDMASATEDANNTDEEILETLQGIDDEENDFADLGLDTDEENENQLIPDENEADADDEESDETKDEIIRHKRAKLYPLFDVVKTFCISLGGAAVVSTAYAINPIAGITVAITMTVTGAVVQAVKKYNMEKQKTKDGKLSKEQWGKVGLEFGISALTNVAPYVLGGLGGALTDAGVKGAAKAVAVGASLWRYAGASIVAFRTAINDLEYRAGIQYAKNTYEADKLPEKPQGLKGLVTRIKRIRNAEHEGKLSKKDAGKAGLYSAAKFGAVLAGGNVGRQIGSAVGGNISYSYEDGKATLNADFKKDLKENLSQHTVIGKLIGKFNGLRATNEANLGPNSNDNDATNYLDELDRIEADDQRFDLTKNARRTTFAENDRQWVDGEQHDWYSEDEQVNALVTLKKAGVDDPVAALRKLGSMAQFERTGEIDNNGYQETLVHLRAGETLTNTDAQHILEALDQIDETGDLIGRVNTNVPTQQTTSAPQTAKTVSSSTAQTQSSHTSTDTSFNSSTETSTETMQGQSSEDTRIKTPYGLNQYHTPGDDTIEDIDMEVNSSEDFGIETEQTAIKATPNQGSDNIRIKTPYGLNDYHTPTDDGLSHETQDLTYGGNDGENDYFFDEQGNEIVTPRHTSISGKTF